MSQGEHVHKRKSLVFGGCRRVEQVTGYITSGERKDNRTPTEKRIDALLARSRART